MAMFFPGESHTFSEYLLVPGYSSSECIPANVNLKTPLVKFKRGEESAISLNIPMVSAIMQSVSGEEMGIALATEGGMSFIYGNQTPESEAAMVKAVKDHKAGFVVSDSTLTPDMTMAEVMDLKNRTGHSTMPVTEDGTRARQAPRHRDEPRLPPQPRRPEHEGRTFMTPREQLIVGDKNITLKKANDVIWDNKLNALPVVDENDHLVGIVFRKDYDTHKANPNELLDAHKRYMVGAGINTRDYEDSACPLLLEAGADVLCIDSSEGFTEWQKRTHRVDPRRATATPSRSAPATSWTATASASSPTAAPTSSRSASAAAPSASRASTKGIGRGQATALIDVSRARDEYLEQTGVYVPVCSDGGIVYDHHMTLALAMGADFLMLGRYFARFDESPTAQRQRQRPAT